MTRKTFPVPEDRSIYSPAVLLESKDIDYLFQKANGKPTDPDNLRETINWITDKAKELGWHEVTIYGGRQVVLVAKVILTHVNGTKVTSDEKVTSTLTEGEFESYQE